MKDLPDVLRCPGPDHLKAPGFVDAMGSLSHGDRSGYRVGRRRENGGDSPTQNSDGRTKRGPARAVSSGSSNPRAARFWQDPGPRLLPMIRNETASAREGVTIVMPAHDNEEEGIG